jgi:putative ABC transport system permease protein
MTLREMLDRLRTWAHRDRLEAEVATELEEHTRLLARDFEQEGMSSSDAVVAARRQLGHLTTQRETTRDAWGFPAIDIIIQDLRYTLRGLRRSPLFTATAVLTLGLGVGANAAIFAVIDRLMFRPLPYMADPSAVSRVYLQVTTRDGRRVTNSTMPYTRYLDIMSASRSFSDHAAISEWRLSVGLGQETRVRKVAGVSASLFKFFSVTPAAGRFFGPADDVMPQGNPVVVLSNAHWLNAYGGADVVGRRLRIGMIDYTIIGVAPAEFIGVSAGRPPELFVPITTIPAAMEPWSRDTYYKDYRWDWVDILVRRKPGVSASVASSDLAEAYRQSRARQRAWNPRVLADSIARPAAIAGPVRTAAGPGAGLETRVLRWVAGVAGIVLLIACANVTNLMLARILRRRREIALRLALGVSRARLAAQFATEALTLAIMGAVAGLLIAQWAGAGIHALLMPGSSTFSLAKDSRTIGLAVTAAICAALLTVTAPLILAMRSDLSDALKAGAREGGYRTSWVRSSLLVMQGALSVALLVGAGLFVRSLDNVLAIPLGYDVSTVLDVWPDFRGDEPDSAGQVALRRRMLAAAQAVPGVEAAARVNSPIFATNTANLKVKGIDSVEQLGRFNFQLTTPDYFKVMRTRILRGRGFDQRDAEGAAPSAIISSSMARALWPGKEALGQCIQVTFGSEAQRSTPPCVTVVGIAEDAAQRGLTDEQRFTYYLPVDQVDPTWAPSLYVRVSSEGDIASHIERLRREMQAVMPGSGFVTVTPVQKRVDDEQRAWRLGATLFPVFGLLALMVAAIGLYGVTGYNVAQRMHELGVRIALGARSGDILGLVMKDSLVITASGVAIGFAIALAFSRSIQPLLYKLSSRDPMTYGAIAVTMFVVALVASAAPAARATRADPNRALRSE